MTRAQIDSLSVYFTSDRPVGRLRIEVSFTLSLPLTRRAYRSSLLASIACGCPQNVESLVNQERIDILQTTEKIHMYDHYQIFA